MGFYNQFALYSLAPENINNGTYMGYFAIICAIIGFFSTLIYLTYSDDINDFSCLYITINFNKLWNL